MSEMFITLDTETANTFDDPLVYDIGGMVHDLQGNEFECFSFIISDIWNNKELMNNCHFAEKIPLYEYGLQNGAFELRTLFQAKMYLRKLCIKYKVKAIICHNASFDYRSTTRTQRYITKSKFRYFLPYGVELWDTLKMARQIMPSIPQYTEFCTEHNFLTSFGKPQLKAETLYAFITNNPHYSEQHTALEDVLIEKEIFSFLAEQEQFEKIQKKCFE